jgi:hypothetical protein
LILAENLIDYDRRVSRNLISIVGETQFCEMEDFDVVGQILEAKVEVEVQVGVCLGVEVQAEVCLGEEV